MTRIFSHNQRGMTRLSWIATFAILLGTLGIVIAQDSTIRREKGSASSAELQRSKSATQEEKRREKEPPKPDLRPKPVFDRLSHFIHDAHSPHIEPDGKRGGGLPAGVYSLNGKEIAVLPGTTPDVK